MRNRVVKITIRREIFLLDGNTRYHVFCIHVSVVDYVPLIHPKQHSSSEWSFSD
jgi:hypothetical protein